MQTVKVEDYLNDFPQLQAVYAGCQARVIEVDGKPFFSLADVCRFLKIEPKGALEFLDNQVWRYKRWWVALPALLKFAWHDIPKFKGFEKWSWEGDPLAKNEIAHTWRKKYEGLITVKEYAARYQVELNPNAEAVIYKNAERLYLGNERHCTIKRSGEMFPFWVMRTAFDFFSKGIA